MGGITSGLLTSSKSSVDCCLKFDIITQVLGVNPGKVPRGYGLCRWSLEKGREQYF